MTISPEALFSYFKKALKPLVALAVRYSIPFQSFSELLKLLYLEAAREETLKQNAKITDSKLSVMTGIQRREIKRVKNIDDYKAGQTGQIFKIVGRWQNHKKYSGASGPRSLSFGFYDSEFNTLVEEVSKDLNPAAVLAELCRAKLVEIKADKVQISKSDYVPSVDCSAQLNILAEDFCDLSAAALENITNPTPLPNLHRRTIFDNINPAALPEIQTWLLEEGIDLHKRARAYLSQYDLDLNPSLKFKEPGAKVILGAFSKIYQKK